MQSTTQTPILCAMQIVILYTTQISTQTTLQTAKQTTTQKVYIPYFQSFACLFYEIMIFRRALAYNKRNTAPFPWSWPVQKVTYQSFQMYVLNTAELLVVKFESLSLDS